MRPQGLLLLLLSPTIPAYVHLGHQNAPLDRRRALLDLGGLLGTSLSGASLLIARQHQHQQQQQQQQQQNEAAADRFYPPSQNALGEELRREVREWRDAPPPTFSDAKAAASGLMAVRLRLEQIDDLIVRSSEKSSSSSSSSSNNTGFNSRTCL